MSQTGGVPLSGPDDTLATMREFVDECANISCPDVEIRRATWNRKEAVTYVQVAVRLANQKRSGPFTIRLCPGCHEQILTKEKRK